MITAQPRPLMIKPEPVDDRIPNRKRSGTLSVLREIAPKKIKAEPENLPFAGADVKPLPSTSTEAIRGELLDLQADVNRLQPQLDRYRRKGEKTTNQLKKEIEITNQLIALHQKRKDLTEMLPAISAPTHPIPGPSFLGGAADGFVQPRQPLALVHPSVPAITVASDPNLLTKLFKHEPMETEWDGDDATPPPTSDADSFPLGDIENNMLIDGTHFDAEYYNFGIAKADE